MAEFDRLDGPSDWIDLGFVERERTPRELIEVGIQLHVAGISRSNTRQFLERLGVERSRTAIHNRVQKTDVQPTSDRQPNHIAVDETVIQLNDERHWLYAAVDPESRTILGVVVIEDVLTALGFALLSVFLLGGSDVSTAVLSVSRSILFLLVLLVAAYYGAGLLERLFSTASSEIFLIGVLGIGALVAGAGLMAGVSEAVTAFLVGTAFGRTRYIDRIERLVAPSRDLFAAVFFFVIGLQTNPALLFDTAELVFVAVVVTTVGQLASGYLAGRAYGLDRRRSTRVGCALSPRGEFSLVIAAFLTTAGTTPALRESIPSFTVGYVLITSILGPVLMHNCTVFERVLELFSSEWNEPPGRS